MKQDEELDRLKSWTRGELCHYLAMKVRKHRREAGVSKADFAKHAGIPVHTYKRFESHGRATLEKLIEVLRATERTRYLFMLFPAPLRLSATPSLDDRCVPHDCEGASLWRLHATAVNGNLPRRTKRRVSGVLAARSTRAPSTDFGPRHKRPCEPRAPAQTGFPGFQLSRGRVAD